MRKTDFLKKNLLDTCPSVGPLISLLWTTGDISSWFQSQSGFFLIWTWQRHTWYICYLRFTCGVTPLPVYNASILACCLPHMHISAEVGCRDLNHWPPAWQSDMLPSWPRWLKFCLFVSGNDYCWLQWENPFLNLRILSCMGRAVSITVRADVWRLIHDNSRSILV